MGECIDAMTSIVGTTESPHANLLDLLHFTPRALRQKARNPASTKMSQFEDGWSTHTYDAPDTRGVLLCENDFKDVQLFYRNWLQLGYIG